MNKGLTNSYIALLLKYNLRLQKHFKTKRIALQQSYFSSDVPSAVKKINIPQYVERGPTDILKALSATVPVNTSGPEYKFHDDPYLYPISMQEKRSYSLSKESGRKAARWVRDTHADLFNHQPDDPIIQEYLPKMQVDENSEVSEADLLKSIQYFQVQDSISIFELCQSKNIELSDATRQSLLELVCFYNCEEAIEDDWLEERRMQLTQNNMRPTKTWKDQGLAERLFEGLKETGVAPYCAIVKGMCNYYQCKRGWELYQECLNRGHIPDTDTFNALLRASPLLREENDLRFELLEEILRTMVDLGIRPNLGTLNACLETLSNIRNWARGRAKTVALQVMAEFSRLGVEPSLASYYFLLRIFYTLRNPSTRFLSTLLDSIENEEFTMRHTKDTLFFFQAMEICNRDLQSFATAQRLLAMVRRGNNLRLIGENSKENNFYRHYLTLAVNSLPLDEFMRLYDEFVPHAYSPDRIMMNELIRVVGVEDQIDLIPRLWSDAIRLQCARNQDLMETTLMVVNKHALESVADEALKERLANVASDIWSRIQNQSEKTRIKVEWGDAMLGDCLCILVRCGACDQAATIFKEVLANPYIVLGPLLPETLKVLLEAFIKEHPSLAPVVVKYAKDNDIPEASQLLKTLQENSSSEIK